MTENDQFRVGRVEFGVQNDEIRPKQSTFADLGSKITNFLIFKAQIDSIARSLEKIAEVLDRLAPQGPSYEPLPRLTDKDFSQSTNASTFEQDMLESVIKLNPDIANDPDSIIRAREFIHNMTRG